jgi:hypothetical protein
MTFTSQLRAAVSGQRRIVQVGVLLMLAAVVVATFFGSPAVGAFFAAGIVLAIANSIFTEYSLARMVASGDELSRSEFAKAALMRLAAVSLVAFGLVAVFWHVGGIAVLVGLAFFQMMTLMMQGIPLLKELHKV